MNDDFQKGMPRFAAAAGPVGAGPLRADQLIAMVGAAAADVSKAEEKGFFVPLPQSEPSVSKDVSRIKTIRNRLFILGYLAQDTGRGNLDPLLSEAIRAFQAEAGLETDGWVGEEETWPALQELVSFETPIDLSKWFSGGRPCPALRRAVALRLFVFGMLEKRPDSADVAVEEGLKTFGQILGLLFADAPQTEPGLSPEWVNLLFDMDGITQRLSQGSAELGKEQMNRCHPFILNAAKVELWLMGYTVLPGGYDLVEKKIPDSEKNGELTGTDVWMKSATLSQYNKIKKNLLFYKALHSFWLDQGENDAGADQKSVEFLEFFQDFFKAAADGIQRADAMDAAERQVNLETFILERKDQIPSIWETVKRLGARIWDGVRRIWGWFVRMLKRVKERVLKISTNLSRLIYDFALGSFTVVSRVFDSLATVVRWVAEPTLPGSDEANILFYRDSDNDMYAIAAAGADPGRVLTGCTQLAAATGKFAFGCLVAGTFVFLLRKAVNSAWKGYFGLVLALVQLRSLKHRLQELTEAYQAVYADGLSSKNDMVS